jgi:Reverse transcriptase (RNA-dependent DNA polymerase)
MKSVQESYFMIFQIFYGFHYQNLQHLTHSFLKDRSFQVYVNKTCSSLINIPAGVPQGSVLSPSFYNIYNHDIPGHNETDSAFFADDTAIYSSDTYADTVVNSLQEHTDSLLQYFNDRKIKINSTKTEATYFTRRRAMRFIPDSSIDVNGLSVPWESRALFLTKSLHFECI